MFPNNNNYQPQQQPFITANQGAFQQYQQQNFPQQQQQLNLPLFVFQPQPVYQPVQFYTTQFVGINSDNSTVTNQPASPLPPVYGGSGILSPHQDDYLNDSSNSIVDISEWDKTKKYESFTKIYHVNQYILDNVAKEGSILMPQNDTHRLHAWCIHVVMIRMGISIPTNPTAAAVIERIGKGGFGSVYKISGNRVLKIVAFGDDFATHEKETKKQFDHPNLLKLERAFVYPQGTLLLMVFPYMEHGSLKDKQFTLVQYWKIISQLTRALEHLDAENVVHRDIKPDNILIREKDDDCDDIKVVLSDFGLSRTTESCSSGAAGTNGFIAPELSEPGEIATDETDVYSLGKTISVLCIGKNIIDRIYFKELQDFTELHPLTKLLNRMMHPEPHSRPALFEISEICTTQLKLLENQHVAGLMSYKQKFIVDKRLVVQVKSTQKKSSLESQLFQSVENDFSRMSISENYHERSQFSSKNVSNYANNEVDAMSISSSVTKPQPIHTKAQQKPIIISSSGTQPKSYISISSSSSTSKTTTATNQQLYEKLPISPLPPSPRNNEITKPSFKYSFNRHKEDGCVNAKALIQIECTAQARDAIRSIKLRIYNSKCSKELDVTKQLGRKSSGGAGGGGTTFTIEKSYKTALLSGCNFEGERGKDKIDLYINDSLVDSASYVSKNN